MPYQGRLPYTYKSPYNTTLDQGTQTVPSLAFLGDTNNGLFSPATDNVAITTNGLERFRVDSNGKLILGYTSARSNLSFSGTTISPLYQVESSGSESSISIIRNATNNNSCARIILGKNNSATVGTNTLVDTGEILGEFSFSGNDGTNFIVGSSITTIVDGTPSTNTMPSSLVFSTATSSSTLTEKVRITSDGNIGVGTTNPNTYGYGGSVLGLYGASNLGGNIWLTSDATVAGNRAGRIGFGLEQNGSDKEIVRIWALSEGTTTGNLGGRLVFSTKSDGVSGAATERVRITSTGNVGIGTTNPTSKLHVYNGDLELSGGYNLTWGGTFSGGNPTIWGNASNKTIRFAPDGTTTGLVALLGVSSSYILGNVGIGTTNPADKLDVNGNILPTTDATYNLGSSTKRWANIYSADLQLSNEGSSNDVDGTWGAYTIQEGENDLYLLNRRNGKKYKFVLQEVN